MTGLTREPCTAGTLVTAGHGFYPLCGLAGPRHPAASAVRGNRLPSVRKPIGMHGLLLAATCMLLASPLYAQSGWCPATLVPGSPAARAVLRDAEKRLADAPRPLPVVRTEGLLPGQGGREASAVARRDLPKMRTFALAWRLSADRRHLSALARYLDAWTATYRLSYSPIDETHFEAMIDAYAVAGPDLPEPTRQATAAFLRSMAAGYIERMERGRGVPRDTWTNNWQSHRVKLVSMAAAALVDERLFGAARKLYGEQLQATIRDDGSVEDFHQRDALHYVIYRPAAPGARSACGAHSRRRLAGRWYGPPLPGPGTAVAAALCAGRTAASGIRAIEGALRCAAPRRRDEGIQRPLGSEHCGRLVLDRIAAGCAVPGSGAITGARAARLDGGLLEGGWKSRLTVSGP